MWYQCNTVVKISIHALLAESDGYQAGPEIRNSIFLSTLSLRRATDLFAISARARLISIHALLAESDNTSKKERMLTDISIHALLAESDTIFAVRPYDAPIFLSTLSLRRATPRLSRVVPTPIFLSTLSLRRATYFHCL